MTEQIRELLRTIRILKNLVKEGQLDKEYADERIQEIRKQIRDLQKRK